MCPMTLVLFYLHRKSTRDFYIHVVDYENIVETFRMKERNWSFDSLKNQAHGVILHTIVLNNVMDCK